MVQAWWITVSQAQVSTHRGFMFFKVFRWQISSFQLIEGSRLFFSNATHRYTGNKLCSWASGLTIKLLIWNWLRARKASQVLQGGRKVQVSCTFATKNNWLCLAWSPSTSNSYLRLIKNWQVNSGGKFMQQVENCLLIAEANRVLCHLPMFLTAFFSLDLQNEIQLLSACYQDSSVILGCFFFAFLVEKFATCQKVIGNHPFQK